MRSKTLRGGAAALMCLVACLTVAGAADLQAEGERLFMANKPAEAVAILEQAVRTQPEEQTWLYLGLCYQQLNRLDDAIGAYRKGLATSVRKRYQFLYNIGNCYYLQGKNAFADEMYGQAIQERADFAPAFLNRANVRMRLASYKDAAADYSVYLTLDPTTPQEGNIRRLLALLGGEIAAADKAKAEEEARKLAEAQAKQALLDSLSQSLKDSAGDTTTFTGGTDDPQGYPDEPTLEN